MYSNPMQSYGTPISELVQQADTSAIRNVAGLGQIQLQRMKMAEMEREQQNEREIEALWQRAEGDPEKFFNNGGVARLSPERAMQFRARVLAMRQGEQQQADAERKRAALSRLPGTLAMRGGGGPTRDNAALLARYGDLAAADPEGFAKHVLDAELPKPKEFAPSVHTQTGLPGAWVTDKGGNVKYQPLPEGVKVTPRMGGSSAVYERVQARTLELQEKARTEGVEALTPSELDELSLNRNYLEKLSQFAPAMFEREAESENTLLAKMRDPNTSPDERKRLGAALSDYYSARAKKGTVLATTTAPDGSATQSVVRVAPSVSTPGVPPAPQGLQGGPSIIPPPPPLPGQVVGGKPPKALPAGIQSDIAQNTSALDLLDIMENGLSQSGWFKGLVSEGQARFPDILGKNEEAEGFIAARDNFHLAMQSAVKGTPSDKDMQMVLKTLPSLWGPKGLNRVRFNVVKGRIGNLLQQAVEFNAGKGVYMPPDIVELAQRLRTGAPKVGTKPNRPGSPNEKMGGFTFKEIRPKVWDWVKE